MACYYWFWKLLSTKLQNNYLEIYYIFLYSTKRRKRLIRFIWLSKWKWLNANCCSHVLRIGPTISWKILHLFAKFLSFTDVSLRTAMGDALSNTTAAKSAVNHSLKKATCPKQANTSVVWKPSTLSYILLKQDKNGAETKKLQKQSYALLMFDHFWNKTASQQLIETEAVKSDVIGWR